MACKWYQNSIIDELIEDRLEYVGRQVEIKKHEWEWVPVSQERP